MRDDFFIDLLKRYREGDVTPEERRLLENYYRSFDAIKPDVTGSMSEEELEQIRTMIKEGIAPDLQTKRFSVRWINWREIAVAAIALIVSGMLVLLYVDRTGKVPALLSHEAAVGSRAKANNLVYLPDGSKVILSAGSTLAYPDSFDGLANREVELEGEAYFDVERLPNQPFIVRSGKLKTTVLGTSFNVKAVSGEESITVTVISGKVQVADEKEVFKVLLPDEQMVYHVEEEKREVSKVDAGVTVVWKRDDLYCDDITVEQAIELVEERYGVSVVVTDDELKQKRFTTTFGKEESLESVLNSLALFNDAMYTLTTDDEGRTQITLTRK